MEITRRRALSFGALLLAAPTIAACSTGSANGAQQSTTAMSTDSFPVTIQHAFGETIIEKAPTRVVAAGWGGLDLALGYGVIPVAAPLETWGANENGSMPWTDEAMKALGVEWGSEKAPVQYSTADGNNYVEVAKAQPDLIICVHSGLTKEDYEQFSKIAPTLAYPGKPWSTSWQDATTMVGQALGQSAKAKQLVDETTQFINDQAGAYPEIKGKTFISTAISPGSASPLWIYGPNDARSLIMKDLGLSVSPVIEKAIANGFNVTEPWAPERAKELEADLVINWVPDGQPKEAAINDPLIGQIPALKRGSYVAEPDLATNNSLTVSTPLGIRWGLEKFVPQFAEALKNA